MYKIHLKITLNTFELKNNLRVKYTLGLFYLRKDLFMFIECNEKCPYQESGYCCKTNCGAENYMFESYNLCPYASISIVKNHTEKKQQKQNTIIYSDSYY